ncbi:MAG TPA: DEAD/DEAH box helicase [Bacteroidia bacterium]|nr:DEAD/DEAH box helicase [Bacteroidia bacterium]
MSTFNDLNLSKQLLRALDDLGFTSPTPIQEKAFSIIMSGKDAIGIAQTGTGKTFAYILPLLRQLTYSDQRQPRVLIVVPTRELVVQVVSEIEKLTKYMTVRCVGVYGGVKMPAQAQQVYNGVDVLVATPGRLMDLYLSRALQLNSVKKLVIDEVDEMLNLGFRPQLMQILDVLPPKRQNLLFSATLTEEVEKMIADYFYTPEYIETISRGTPSANITQYAYQVPNFYTKVNLLQSLLANNQSISKALLFVRNKKVADALYQLVKVNFPNQISLIHSNKSQQRRFTAVRQLQDGTHRLLIATDVIARGIDITDVTHVINFDIPQEAAVYIHRIGRTGRAEKTGISISFITPAEKEKQKEIEELMNKKIEMLRLPGDVEISDELTPDEIPFKKDKNLGKNRKDKNTKAPGPAFTEKKEKNKKVNLGGARRRENQRRKLEKSIRNRSKR